MIILFDINTILLFIGGLFSLFLTAVIIYSKQESKRDIERKRLKIEKKRRPEIGDIEQKLNDTYGYAKLSFVQELTKYGLQPLVIISFVNIFSTSNEIVLIINGVLTFILVMYIIMHEFWAAFRNSKKRWYQLMLLTSWIAMFLYISFTNNLVNKNDNNVGEQLSTTRNSVNFIESIKIKDDKIKKTVEI